jgi:hypothetical protein
MASSVRPFATYDLNASRPIEKVTIGNATLYRANCFDVLPTLNGIGAAVIDPSYCIGFRYTGQVRRPDELPDSRVGAHHRQRAVLDVADAVTILVYPSGERHLGARGNLGH